MITDRLSHERYLTAVTDIGGGSPASGGFRPARVRIAPASLALLVATVILAAISRTAFNAAHRQIGWAFASVIVAGLLMPMVTYLDRYVPRWLALLSTMLGIGLMTAVVWTGVVVNLRSGLRTLENEAPKAATSLESKYEWARQFRLVERVDALIAQFHQPGGGAAVNRAVGTAGTYFVCGILTLFFLVYGPRMMKSGFEQIRDRHRRLRAERVVFRAMARARGYIFAAIIQAVLVGLVVGMVAWMMDLPAPFVLGALAGAIGAIPTLGIVIGGLPALLLAFGLNGGSDAWLMALVVISLQVVEVQFVRKRVDDATVHLGPALPTIVALLGYESYGIGGAAYGAAGLVFLIAWMDAVGFDSSPAPVADEAIAE